MTTDSDTVFREESIGEGFKIVTVAVFEKILLFEKKIGSSLTAIFKLMRVVTKFGAIPLEVHIRLLPPFSDRCRHCRGFSVKFSSALSVHR